MRVPFAGGWANVSRETIDRLEQYESLLRKWNPRINLVSQGSLDALWTRHFADSAQIFHLAPPSASQWADLGSGGGFPGLVIAILAAEARPMLRLTLVESDQRKAAFLATAAHALGVSVDILARRIEALAPLRADVVSARGLAPLDTLLGYAERHLAPGGVALFPKGATVGAELDRALEHWRFCYQKEPSTTDPQGVVLITGGISRV
ncbi:16S rRNA (guanine(527)-N(7))-methyltransferase RsmG [Albidovulum sp.]|jgi:16S rRNA (guanine527-N7)-methyltransferase|uniref:16S rRNA (guanine(527)-N(7))-methyltransferase RsmG n=1 Tax=Albidovulum sp. TaxID=1872424 RepID=UPI0030685445